MTPIQIEAEALFDRYLKAWNRRDAPTVAACFVEPAMFVTAKGTLTLPDRATTISVLEKFFADLDAAGFDRTTIGPVHALACADGLAVIDALDIQRLRKDGSLLEALDGHYIMRRTDQGWRFLVAMTCEPGWRDG